MERNEEKTRVEGARGKKNIIMKEIERREEESEGIDERNRSRDGLKRLEK